MTIVSVPLFRFTEPSYTVDEDDSPVRPVIELFSDTVLTFPIQVQVVDLPNQGSATGKLTKFDQFSHIYQKYFLYLFVDGIDYTGVSVTLRFPTGSSQNSQLPFDVPIIDDVLVEGEETILLEASTSAPGEVPQDAPGQPRTTIIIRDDDRELTSYARLLMF